MKNFNLIKEHIVAHSVLRDMGNDFVQGVDAEEYQSLFRIKTDKPYEDDLFVEGFCGQIIDSMKYFKISDYMVAFLEPQLGPGFYTCGWIALGSVA